MRYSIQINGKGHQVEVSRSEDGWHCQIDGRSLHADVRSIGADTFSFLIEGRSFEVRRGSNGSICVSGRQYDTSVVDSKSWRGRQRAHASEGGPQPIKASMPGKIVRVLTKEGAQVSAGQGLVVVEAMKMQNEIKSPKSGVLKKLLAQPGTNVNSGEVLAIVE